MNKPLIIICLLCALTHTMPVSALSSDRDQPAQIEADDTFIDFKTGVRTLTNNVLVVQGTLRLKADKLVGTYNKQGELVKAVADGSLARFKQRPDNQPQDVEGWAKKMIVDYPTNTITLIGKAALKQGETTATGKKIVYNMATDKLQILGGTNIGVAGKPGTAKPKRKIEDPFNDNAQGPAPAPVAKTATSSSEETKASTDTEETQAEQEPQAKPLKSGRSRLILQPKKKK